MFVSSHLIGAAQLLFFLELLTDVNTRVPRPFWLQLNYAHGLGNYPDLHGLPSHGATCKKLLLGTEPKPAIEAVTSPNFRCCRASERYLEFYSGRTAVEHSADTTGNKLSKCPMLMSS